MSFLRGLLDQINPFDGGRTFGSQQQQPIPNVTQGRGVDLSAIQQGIQSGALQQRPQQPQIPQVSQGKPLDYSAIQNSVRSGGLQPMTPQNGLQQMNPQQGDFANQLRRRLGL